MFGGKAPAPPPPPPPPANPPTYASAIFSPPSNTSGIMGGLGMGGAIQTSPFGTIDSKATQRKSLFGQ